MGLFTRRARPITTAGANFTTAAGTSVSFFYQENLSSYRVNLTSPFEDGLCISYVYARRPGPGPPTWAMMILGFAGIGAMTYRRRKTTMIAA